MPGDGLAVVGRLFRLPASARARCADHSDDGFTGDASFYTQDLHGAPGIGRLNRGSLVRELRQRRLRRLLHECAATAEFSQDGAHVTGWLSSPQGCLDGTFDGTLSGETLEGTLTETSFGSRATGTFSGDTLEMTIPNPLGIDGHYETTVGPLGGPGSQEGRFLIRASKPGFRAQTIEATLSGEITANFTLEPDRAARTEPRPPPLFPQFSRERVDPLCVAHRVVPGSAGCPVAMHSRNAHRSEGLFVPDRVSLDEWDSPSMRSMASAPRRQISGRSSKRCARRSVVIRGRRCVGRFRSTTARGASDSRLD